MTLLINYSGWAIAILGALAWWKTKSVWAICITILMVAIYLAAQPSYFPKGEIQREAISPDTSSQAAIQDRTPKPDDLATRDQRMKNAVQNGLDFKK